MTDQNGPKLLAENVHKAYGRNEVLRGIDMQVRTGEVACIIGPSGEWKVDVPALHKPPGEDRLGSVVGGR